MISKRLTEIQKTEILEAYLGGCTPNEMAVKYKCTSTTIIRIVKKLISEEEYIAIKQKRQKETKIKAFNNSSNLFDSEKNPKDSNNKLNKLAADSPSEKDTNDNLVELNYQDLELSKDQDYSSFDEIAPLESSIGFDTEKQKIIIYDLNNEILPESVYMLVDKKVELESQVISELPEWSFLPENELKRLAILLFPNQRSAKRSCSRNQRVIKIPNTSVFSLSRTYLVSKGITRLILEDSLISLENN